MTQAVSPAPTKPDKRDLEKMFAPASVAVVGASRKEGSVGHAITRNLIIGGYMGVVSPINPKARSILGVRCVPGVGDLDETPDLGVIIVPAPAVLDTIEQLAAHGTRHFVVISAGFKEIDGEGKQREQALRDLARQRDLSILGPNCLGVINTAADTRLNATFARDMPDPGAVGLLSQSGALCTALLDYAKGRGIGFSRFVSFGNKVDINENDLLQSLADDPKTRVILMYIEDITEGRAFIETAYAITHSNDPTPILAIKTGRTPQGAAAAASHTGSLAGSDEVYDAIMAQAGVLRVDSVKDLFDFARAFTDPIKPRGRRTAIVTNAGGPGIMATDAAIRYGLRLTKFQDYTIKSLRYQLPPTSALSNPVDVIGDARHDRYRAALDAVAADEGVDQIAVIVTPQTMTDVREIAEVIGEIKDYCTKPVVAAFMGLVDVAPGVEILRSHGVPTYIFPEDAMRSLAAKNQFAEWSGAPDAGFPAFDVDRRAAEALIGRERGAGRHQIIEVHALELLRHYGFPVVPFKLARHAEEAVQAAREMGYPVVLKVAAPSILHKTDVGGIRLDLDSEEAVRDGYDDMFKAVRENVGEEVEIWGAVVEKMLPKGREVILGMTHDPSFGPLLMFGLGGIYTEALRDVSFRVAPIREDAPDQMMRDIRSIKLLQGVRGESPADLKAVGACLLRLSQLVTELSDIKELDINPLIVYPRDQGAMVADARIILHEVTP